MISEDDEENCSIEDGLEALFNDELQYGFLEDYLEITTDSEDIINYFKRRNKEKLELAKVILNYEKIINEKLYLTNEEELVEVKDEVTGGNKKQLKKYKCNVYFNENTGRVNLIKFFE